MARRSTVLDTGALVGDDGLLRLVRRVELPDSLADRLRLRSSTLTLRRAWPRDGLRLSLELADADERCVAGQWFGCDDGSPDVVRLERIARQTAAAAQGSVDPGAAGTGGSPAATVVALPERGVLLQTGGADRRLRTLAALRARPGASLVVHRPERRAVVRLGGDQGGPERYVKVVRPGRTEAVVATAAAVTELAFVTPRLLAHDPQCGYVVVSALPGTSLRDLLAAGDATGAAAAAGHALRDFHDTRAGDGLPVRDAATECRWVGVWVDRLRRFAPASAGQAAAALASVATLLSGDPVPLARVHADLHDQQVLSLADGRVGLLDWDTLAVGEAALDLANLLVHLDLRALAGECPPATAAAAGAALLEAYRPDPQTCRRITAYAAAVRLRLWCTYAFRPAPAGLADTLLHRLQSAPSGLA